VTPQKGVKHYRKKCSLTATLFWELKSLQEAEKRVKAEEEEVILQ
jgi:hypothetical protein